MEQLARIQALVEMVEALGRRLDATCDQLATEAHRLDAWGGPAHDVWTAHWDRLVQRGAELSEHLHARAERLGESVERLRDALHTHGAGR